MDDGGRVGELRSEPRAPLQGARIGAAADGDGGARFARLPLVHLAQRLNERAVFVVEQRRLAVQQLIRRAEGVQNFADALLRVCRGIADVNGYKERAVRIIRNIGGEGECARPVFKFAQPVRPPE